MIVKDFLLSLDLDKLSEVYYENHMSKDVYWRHAAQMLGVDLNKKSKQLLKCFIKQISELEPEVNKDKYLIVLKYFDFEYDDDFEMFKTEHYDASILHKNECKKRDKVKLIQTLEEAEQCEQVWSVYGFLFTPWEKVLGLEIGYLPDDKYVAAATIIHLLTFFGFNKYEVDERVEKETAELDKISTEIKSGAIKSEPVNFDALSKELELPQKTPEQEEREDALAIEILIDNLNETHKVYNLLLEQGFFDDCESI